MLTNTLVSICREAQSSLRDHDQERCVVPDIPNNLVVEPNQLICARWLVWYGVKKQVTIGVCEEGTDSKGANLWATF